MKNYVRTLVLLATILLSPIPLLADTIISVTDDPLISSTIGIVVYSTSWLETKSYTNVSIAVLVNSTSPGQTPSATAYLTSRIGPGTTTTDEIAHAQFAVPTLLPVCSTHSCGAFVTLFSGLTLGPGQYFLTLGANTTSSPFVGWFPAENPTVILDTGVSQVGSYASVPPATYPPVGTFMLTGKSMSLIVTGTPVPEPASVILVGIGVLFLLVLRQYLPEIQKY